MIPISVYGAKSGTPFNVDTGHTVRTLHTALGQLIELGHGNTHVIRADYEDGPQYLSKLELYDTSTEKEQGVTLSDMCFLLC